MNRFWDCKLSGAPPLLSFVFGHKRECMDRERYDLYFGSLKVGAVTETGSNWPSLWGTIEYEPWLPNPQTPEAVRFARFVSLNMESTRLMDIAGEVDNSRERAAVDGELKAGFMDYVESQEWWLVDRHGRKLPILCPILQDNGWMGWRWDPRRGQARQAEPGAAPDPAT
jgi:hypothetical protein